MRGSGQVLLFVVLLSSVTIACDDEAPPSTPPGAMLAGPYANSFELTDATRTSLPTASDAVASADDARFYWYAREAASKSIEFEVRAESTVLVAGTVIHRAEEQVREGQIQGMISVGPRDLNRGGAAQVDGSPRWLEGLYSVRIFVDGAELATGIFQVD